MAQPPSVTFLAATPHSLAFTFSHLPAPTPSDARAALLAALAERSNAALLDAGAETGEYDADALLRPRARAAAAVAPNAAAAAAAAAAARSAALGVLGLGGEERGASAVLWGVA